MDDFAARFSLLDKENLKNFLLSLESPCYESTLLKIAFPGMDILNAHPLTLYQNHFLLFHLLYILQNDFYKEDKYLFVHFMRTFLVQYPEEGMCRFYEEHSGRFCCADCIQSYCDFHDKMIGNGELEELSVKYFYLDKQNFYNLDEETAVSFINGTWEILRNYKSFKKSYEILGIPETSDMSLIKKKFRILAKQYHPDHGEKSHDKFNEINRAYRLLLKLLPAIG
ncbi:MAG: DnaJ domain-containing protein [Desulfobacterales bacterium]|nr:DnaJ domain-containing protein [Desulfobacterales bacterium]